MCMPLNEVARKIRVKEKIVFAVVLAMGACSAVAQLAVMPATPDRRWAREWWLPRFDAKRAQSGFEVVFLGDSITHNWESIVHGCGVATLSSDHRQVSQ